MILDASPFTSIKSAQTEFGSSAVTAFITFLQKKLGVSVVYDRASLPFGREDLIEVCELGAQLLKAGVIESFGPSLRISDEPSFAYWYAGYEVDGQHYMASGAALQDDSAALTAALAEALERALWRGARDYFRHPLVASRLEMHKRSGVYVPPERFVGFSNAQRQADSTRILDAHTPLSWIQGTSLVSGGQVYLPAQVVSSAPNVGKQEPRIRSRNTTGLATWPTAVGARLAGALECIERDAYMITWLNQMELPHIDLSAFCLTNPSLSSIITTCKRYGMQVYALMLPTDAPTHVVCVVVEDMSGKPPQFAFGLKAHRSLSVAIEKAAFEALRARRASRARIAGLGHGIPLRPRDLGHYDRLNYWARPENAAKLTSFVSGTFVLPESRDWETDTEEQHLARLIDWCRHSGYECISVPLTGSAKNPTALHIEMVVMPELQPMHLAEADFMEGGTRWQTIPQRFGFTARQTMFRDEPHPFV